MARYYVNMNVQLSGRHEVHTSVCHRVPTIQSRIYLGDFICCHPAVTEARNYYAYVNGCHTCCNNCRSA